MIQKAAYEFRDQVIFGLRLDHCFKQHTIGAAVRIHDQPGAVAVIGYEIRSRRGLGRAVH